MPANNAAGYPYPLDTEPVADGADNIKALADAIAGRLGTIAQGQITITPSAPNTPTSGTVAFPSGRFAGTPRVALTPSTTDPGSCAVGVTAVTPSGCTVVLERTTTTATSIQWIASYIP